MTQQHRHPEMKKYVRRWRCYPQGVQEYPEGSTENMFFEFKIHKKKPTTPTEMAWALQRVLKLNWAKNSAQEQKKALACKKMELLYALKHVNIDRPKMAEKTLGTKTVSVRTRNVMRTIVGII